MIPIVINGDSYALTFQYSPLKREKREGVDSKGRPLMDFIPRQRRSTTCRLLKLHTDQPPTLIAEGTASCSPEDNFSKAIGRELAMEYMFRAARKSGHPLFAAHDLATATKVRQMESDIFQQYLENAASGITLKPVLVR